MPAIRQICKTLKTPAAPHHVYAGVSSILSLPALTTTENNGEVNIPALVVVTYSLVITRLRGVKDKPAEYKRQNDTALEIVKEVGGDSSKNIDVNIHEIQKCMEQVQSQKWTLMDWFGNIPIGAGVENPRDFEDSLVEGSDDDVEDDEIRMPVIRDDLDKDSELAPAYLQPGLGTMVSFLMVVCKLH